ncbi:hypothetical protein DFH08DRAFT_903938 [Mycena albidolilacea]|uniref:DUF4336 domain-containing protein n=1 Tax=Mycena albidolilacea TaxID=1033008 RepID=A0AAD7E901_9AGAR|nr:hypothetical protein DFH08DRAFT_903938 [Mycena albidolilacea]
MSDIVIREVATNVWTFSRPFALFGWIHIGGRSTAVKLASGGVWVVASTPLSPETKAKLDALGPVEYIIGINAMHNMFLGEFKRAYPTAKLIAPAGAVERCSDKTLTFDGLWGKDPADTKYGFEDEIKACYFSGFSNKDVVFFHAPSSTLIEADLVVNLPGTEQSSQRFPFYGPFGKPVGWLQGKLSAARSRDPVAMKRDVQTVAEWDFVRIIPCHGDVLETDAKKIWKDALRSHL